MTDLRNLAIMASSGSEENMPSAHLAGVLLADHADKLFCSAVVR